MFCQEGCGDPTRLSCSLAKAGKCPEDIATAKYCGVPVLVIAKEREAAAVARAKARDWAVAHTEARRGSGD